MAATADPQSSRPIPLLDADGALTLLLRPL